jgi:hypothetical protein
MPRGNRDVPNFSGAAIVESWNLKEVRTMVKPSPGGFIEDFPLSISSTSTITVPQPNGWAKDRDRSYLLEKLKSVKD